MTRMIALLLVLACMVSVGSVCVFAAEANEEQIQPYYLYFISVDKYLKLSGGQAVYEGSAKISVLSTNTVKVTATLQQKVNGVWKAVESRSGSDSSLAIAGNTCNITSGYYYRLRVDASVHTAAGTMIESTTEYSSEKYY